MSLTITTLDGLAGADQTYALLGADTVSSKRIDTASTPTEPKLLQVKHSTSGVGNAAIDRHLIQVTRTRMSATGVPRTGTVNLTLAVPRDTIITAADIQDAIANIVSLVCGGAFSVTTGFTSTGVITQLLRGES